MTPAEDIAAKVLVAIVPIPPEDRLGFLAGLVAGLLREQGFSWDNIRAEFEKMVDNFENEECEPEPAAVCEVCTNDILADEVEPACPECGLDGCCADCMAEHECEA